MQGLAVVAETLTVIAHDNDLSRLIGEARLERGQQAAGFPVHESDLACVGIVRVLRAERLGRLVRRMRVEIVHPEELGGGVSRQVRQRCVSRPHRTPFFGIAGIVVFVETARQPELRC